LVCVSGFGFWDFSSYFYPTKTQNPKRNLRIAIWTGPKPHGGVAFWVLGFGLKPETRNADHLDGGVGFWVFEIPKIQNPNPGPIGTALGIPAKKKSARLGASQF
jgi:hypothetical protein